MPMHRCVSDVPCIVFSDVALNILISLMGPSNSQAKLRSQINPSEWILAEQDNTNCLFSDINPHRSRLFFNNSTQQLIEEYELEFISQEDFLSYLDSLEQRKKSHSNRFIYPVLHFVDTSKSQFCSTIYTGLLYADKVDVRLKEIHEIPFLDQLHMYNATLHGFARLNDIYGFFTVREEMIFIDRGGRVKVWINSNISSNQPQEDFNEDSQYLSESKMIHAILNFIEDNTDQQTMRLPHFTHYLQEKKLYRYITFANCLAEFKAYCDTFTVTVPSYMKSIRDLYLEEGAQLHQSRLPRDNHEERSSQTGSVTSNGHAMYRLDRSNHNDRGTHNDRIRGARIPSESYHTSRNDNSQSREVVTKSNHRPPLPASRLRNDPHLHFSPSSVNLKVAPETPAVRNGFPRYNTNQTNLTTDRTAMAMIAQGKGTVTGTIPGVPVQPRHLVTNSPRKIITVHRRNAIESNHNSNSFRSINHSPAFRRDRTPVKITFYHEGVPSSNTIEMDLKSPGVSRTIINDPEGRNHNSRTIITGPNGRNHNSRVIINDPEGRNHNSRVTYQKNMQHNVQHNMRQNMRQNIQHAEQMIQHVPQAHKTQQHKIQEKAEDTQQYKHAENHSRENHSRENHSRQQQTRQQQNIPPQISSIQNRGTTVNLQSRAFQRSENLQQPFQGSSMLKSEQERVEHKDIHYYSDFNQFTIDQEIAHDLEKYLGFISN